MYRLLTIVLIRSTIPLYEKTKRNFALRYRVNYASLLDLIIIVMKRSNQPYIVTYNILPVYSYTGTEYPVPDGLFQAVSKMNSNEFMLVEI